MAQQGPIYTQSRQLATILRILLKLSNSIQCAPGKHIFYTFLIKNNQHGHCIRKHSRCTTEAGQPHQHPKRVVKLNYVFFTYLIF